MSLTAVIVLSAAPILAIPAATAEDPLTSYKICLDPVHGYPDPGAVNEEFDLLEKDINLDVSLALRDLLKTDGADVVMTRESDIYLDNRDRYTYCNDERATILVSVHTNSTTDDTIDGALGLYFHEDDKTLAGAIYEVMLDQLGSTAPVPEGEFTAFGLTKYTSGVLLKSNMPATIAESLFMSNPLEAQELKTPIPQEGCGGSSIRRCQIAKAIHQGVPT